MPETIIPWKLFLMSGLAFFLMFGPIWGGKNSSPGLTGNIESNLMARNFPNMYKNILRAHVLLSQLHLHFSLQLWSITWHHAQCLRDTRGASVEGPLMLPAAVRPFQGQQLAGWELEPLHSVLPLSTLQPAKANPKQGLSKITQPSSSSALRSTLIPHQESWGTQVSWYTSPGLDTSHQSTQSSWPLLALFAGCLLMQRGFTCRMRARQVGLCVLTCHFYSWEERISEQLQDIFTHCHNKVTSEEIRNWPYTWKSK